MSAGCLYGLQLPSLCPQPPRASRALIIDFPTGMQAESQLQQHISDWALWHRHFARFVWRVRHARSWFDAIQAAAQSGGGVTVGSRLCATCRMPLLPAGYHRMQGVDAANAFVQDGAVHQRWRGNRGRRD